MNYIFVCPFFILLMQLVVVSTLLPFLGKLKIKTKSIRVHSSFYLVFHVFLKEFVASENQANLKRTLEKWGKILKKKKIKYDELFMKLRVQQNATRIQITIFSQQNVIFIKKIGKFACSTWGFVILWMKGRKQFWLVLKLCEKFCTNRDRRKVFLQQRTNYQKHFGVLACSKKCCENSFKNWFSQWCHFEWMQWTHLTFQARSFCQLIVFIIFMRASFCAVDAIKRIPWNIIKSSFTNNVMFILYMCI